MKTSRDARKLALAAIVAATCVGLSACSKEEKTASTGAKPAAGASTATARTEAPKPQSMKVEGTLLSQIPADSFGFFQVRFDHPAYKKLKDSPWGGAGNDLNTLFQGNTEGLNKVKEVFSKLGLDPLDKKTWETLFAEAVLFASPAQPGKTIPGFGVAFRSQDGNKLQKLLSEAKNELAKGGHKTADITVGQGTGYTVSVAAQGEPAEGPSEVVIAWKGATAVLASEPWVAEKVLSDKGSTPEVLSSPTFTKLSTSLAPDTERFATMYFELGKMIAELQKSAPAEAKDQLAQLPLKALVISLSMGDVPHTTAKLAFDDSKKPAAGSPDILGSLRSSPSAELVSVLPSKPLFFMSFDGASLKNLTQLAMANAGPEAKMFEEQLKFVDDLKRVGVGARLAPLGQSMLPIPDVIFVAEVTSPDRTKAQLEQIAGMMMQSSGLPSGGGWTTKKIENVDVKGMTTPFGPGFFLAANKNLVLVSSSEPVMRSMLAGGGAGFAKEITAKTQDVFSKGDTLGNLYVNFGEVASLMENMGGMMAMMGGGDPSQNPAGELLKRENIDAMRKMGTVVGSVKVEPGVISLESFYQPAA